MRVKEGSQVLKLFTDSKMIRNYNYVKENKQDVYSDLPIE